MTVLSASPCSGYDISKRFDEGVGCYWKASQQQIYRELGKMEQQGWVEFELIPQEGKPDKKVYCVTEIGQQELHRWYLEPTEPTPIREDLLVKVLAGAFMPPDLLLAELKRRRQCHLAQLQQYQAKATAYQAIPHPPVQEQYRYLTLRRGIHYEQDWVNWCDEVLAVLQAEDKDERCQVTGDR
ncbi:PadR family transcriptional regulator [Leptolyngbya sp. PCC 6406]|uniref:PadR family transcriptional regulator n=1 Tax=Leptolyngbya sp. PCC 6406 TaxID=1173264 RepID=UPI0021F23563|nr:PadR family transcriptional regulator [Leptolyngbya sp. PCC 6406]